MTKPAIERLEEDVRHAPDCLDNLVKLEQHGLRLTRALVAESEREIVARIIDPGAFSSFGAATLVAVDRRNVALAKADAILEHFAAMALGEE